MMQIPLIHIFKVIFVLSTIVAVTDCCSSRILLLREHTLKIVQHQHDYHMHEHAHELQQKIEETAVEMLNQLELQRQQLEASAQDADEELHQQADTETDPNPDRDKDKLYAEPVEEASEAGDLAQEADFLGSSTQTWLTLRSSVPTVSSSETVTMSTTVATDTIDQSSSNPLGLSTPSPEDKESNRTNETEVQMLPCSEAYNASFCLNGGHCFQHPMVNNTVFHSCVCVNDYDGERCAYKSWNGDYVYTPASVHRKVRMAHIVFSFPVLIMLSSLYVLFAAVFMLRNVPDYHRRKQQQLHTQRFFVRC